MREGFEPLVSEDSELESRQSTDVICNFSQFKAMKIAIKETNRRLFKIIVI